MNKKKNEGEHIKRGNNGATLIKTKEDTEPNRKVQSTATRKQEGGELRQRQGIREYSRSKREENESEEKKRGKGCKTQRHTRRAQSNRHTRCTSDTRHGTLKSNNTTKPKAIKDIAPMRVRKAKKKHAHGNRY